MNVTTRDNGQIHIHTDDPVLLRWLRDPGAKPPTATEIAAAARRDTDAYAAAHGLVRRSPLLNKARGRPGPDALKRSLISSSDIKAIATATAAAMVTAPQLLDQGDAWHYCGLSRSGWFRLRSAGEIPAPVDVPGVGLRWRRTDLDKWLTRLKPRRNSR